MIHLKKCKTCGFRVKESGKCRITGRIKDPEDFCADHNYNPPVCSRCGAYTLKPIIENKKYLKNECKYFFISAPPYSNINILAYKYKKSKNLGA